MRLHSNSKQQYGLAVAILIVGMALAVVHFGSRSANETQTDSRPDSSTQQQPDEEKVRDDGAAAREAARRAVSVW